MELSKKDKHSQVKFTDSIVKSGPDISIRS